MADQPTDETHEFRKELMDLVTQSNLTKGEVTDELLAAVASCLVLFGPYSFGQSCERLKEHMGISENLLAVRERNPFGFPSAIIDA